MTYNPNIPQTGTRIDQTYNLITTNFGQLNVIFQEDHYTWNDAMVSNRGFHRQCTWVSQTAVPSQSATAGIAFTQVNPAANVTRIDPYYAFDSGALGTGLIAPLVPFKVYCEIRGNIVPPGAVPFTNSFNVASVTATNGTTSTTITVNFTNPLTDDAPGTSMAYLVLLSSGLNDGPSDNRQLAYRSRKNNSVQIKVTNDTLPYAGDANQQSISMGIIQL